MAEGITSRVIHGDCLDVLRRGTAESIDCIVTDPPYGYSFMGKDWDKAVPSVEIWKECLRVLKPGAFAFVMSAPRQDVLSQMIVRLTEAGFDTDFTSIYWTYASGFPKAMNIGKMVDKRMGVERPIEGYESRHINRPVTENWDKSLKEREGYSLPITEQGGGTFPITRAQTPEAKALDGSYGGFQPKPAVEVIIVAMKPLSEKTYVDQALRNGKGVTWLDDCRIPTAQGDTPKGGFGGMKIGMTKVGETQEYTGSLEADARGRFPANLLVSDNALGAVKSEGQLAATTGREPSTEVRGNTYGDYRGQGKPSQPREEQDKSYSRFFSLDAWAKTLPFLIVPKASKREKNEGLEGFDEKFSPTMGNGIGAVPHDPETAAGKKNTHATVKPLTLMSYLITLGSRPGDTILDPFLGSGTTLCAAKALGRKGIGIEREEEYVKIAEARIKAITVK